MAKTTGPLLSLAAHGTLSKILTYSKKRSGNMVRSYHKPDRVVSLKQWTQRHIIGLLTAHWQVKTILEKSVYEDLAKTSGLRISGYTYFLKVAQQDLYTHHGLCGYWPMNESTGAELLDYSGRGNHAAFSVPPPVRVASLRTQYGNALEFNGVNTYTSSITNFLISGDVPVTIMIWIKPIDTRAQAAMHFGAMTAFSSFSIYLNSIDPGSVTCAYQAGNNFNSVGGCFNAGEWSHIAIVKTAGDIDATTQIYVNGRPVAGTYIGVSWPTFCFSWASFGGWNDGTSGLFAGRLDEARLYNRALGADEIEKQYSLLRLNKKR